MKALLERFREEEPYRQERNSNEYECEEDYPDLFIPVVPEPVVHSDADKALLERFRESEEDKDMFEDEISAESAISIALKLYKEDEKSIFTVTARSIEDMQSYVGSGVLV